MFKNWLDSLIQHVKSGVSKLIQTEECFINHKPLLGFYDFRIQKKKKASVFRLIVELH